MDRKIGAVLARTFREFCEDSNKRVRSDFSIVSPNEIKDIEQILKKVDNKNFDLIKELENYFGLEDKK